MQASFRQGMTRRGWRTLVLLPWLALPLVVGAHALLWERLPARVAVHFSTSGAPNGWMSRGGSLLFDACVLFFLLSMFSWKLLRD